ncbi:MAG TPA: MFS transporter [Steroidobacteraceae bacterium]|jgi:MFS family permease|nr:MFS transporter [Steroidobacteraceae bacterium]
MRTDHVTLTPAQVRGFWAAWLGWTLDGMDSFIFALVLAPALTELLPRSGLDGSPSHVAFAGSVLFAVFLAGWGSSLIWGPLADRWGRTRTLAASVACYALFTGAAALSQNVWQLGVFRFFAGVGIGGEWALAGTYVAEVWPESRRKMGAGYLQTGYYAGFFIAAALNFTVGASYGWRVMFLCGGAPVLLALYMLSKLREPDRWMKAAERAPARAPMWEIFRGAYRRRTLVNAALVTISIIGLWAGAVYEPSAIIHLAKTAGYDARAAVRFASFGTGLLSIGTCLGCIAVPPLAERIGRRATLALFFAGMAICIWECFGWAFYAPRNALGLFVGSLFFLGFFGGNFAIYSLWLPEQYSTAVRATAFAFVTSFGRFIGAGVNFLIGAGVHAYGSMGIPVAATAVAFVLGLVVLPFGQETRGAPLPD